MTNLTVEATRLAAELGLSPQEELTVHDVAARGPDAVEHAAAEARIVACAPGSKCSARVAGVLDALSSLVQEERLAGAEARLAGARSSEASRQAAEEAEESRQIAADPALAGFERRMQLDQGTQARHRREVSLISKIAELRSREHAQPRFTAERLRLEAELVEVRRGDSPPPPATRDELMQRAMGEARAELAAEGE